MSTARVYHRDIKPSNIFLVGGKAVIADLGLGRLLSYPAACAYSKVGTPLYFSPELCEEKPYDEKSDVWAFGCVLFNACLASKCTLHGCSQCQSCCRFFVLEFYARAHFGVFL
jgi:serine/threonine protein kinase